MQLFGQLVTRGVNVNAKDKQGITPLHRAAARGFTQIIEKLLESGADINVTDNEKNTPL